MISRDTSLVAVTGSRSAAAARRSSSRSTDTRSASQELVLFRHSLATRRTFFSMEPNVGVAKPARTDS